MKNFIALFLSIVMVFSLVSCAAESDTSSDSENSTSASSSSTATTGEDKVAETLQKTEAYSFFDLMDESAIDTSRKSTYNTDERYPEIVVSTNNEITSWTPWQTPQQRSSLILTVYEPLFYYHDGYTMEPCMAKSWSDEDDTHFVVEIYDYIHDSDGNNITAEDVVASFEAFATSGNANDFAYYESCEAIDTYTVRFTWTKKINSVTSLATMMNTAIFSQKANSEHDFTTDPVGTGAYKLTELVTGSKYVLEPTDYWQTDEDARCVESYQNVDKLTMEVISESNVTYLAFEEGGLFSFSPNSTQLADFLEGGKHYGEYTLAYEQGAGTNGIGFNMSGNSILSDDLNLRLAIAYAIDTDGIVDAIGSIDHYAMHAEGGTTITGYQSQWDTMDNYYSTYDVELAKEYLAKSNYNGEDLTLLILSGFESQNTAMQIIQQELSVIGIKSHIDTYERAIMNTYLYDLTGWDIYFYIWNGEPISQLWARQSDINNYPTGYTETGINDPELQEMIERVQTIDGFTDDLILEIQQYYVDNCLLYAIFGSISWSAFNSDVANICTTHGHKEVLYTASNYYLD